MSVPQIPIASVSTSTGPSALRGIVHVGELGRSGLERYDGECLHVWSFLFSRVAALATLGDVRAACASAAGTWRAAATTV